MEQFLATLLQNSVVGAAFIVLILLFRQMTRDVTKLYVRILWILLVVELFIPPFISSPFGSMRSALELTGESSVYERMTQAQKNPGNTATADFGEGESYTDELYQGEISYAAGSNLSENELPGDRQGAQKQQNFWLTYRERIVFLVWLSGVIAMALYGFEELLKLQRRVRFAVRAEDGAWETEGVETPFVMPSIPARVYLPCGLDGIARENILAHERKHIRYLDPWIKLAAAAALMIHWFNPLVWAAYIMMGKDLEMFCDEGALHGKSLKDKKQYSQTLLDGAVKKSRYSLTVQFGENSTGARIRHILYAKKPKLPVSLLLVFAVCCCGVFFLTKTGAEAGEKVRYGSFPADLSDNEYVQAVRTAGNYSGSAVSFTYAGDYDGDGSTDTFVAIGNVEEKLFEGDIWFAGGDGQTQLLEENISMEPGQEYLSFENSEYLLISYIRGNSVQTDVYTVKDSAPVNELLYTGAKRLDEDGNLICMIESYDADYMIPENLFTGRTAKQYVFVPEGGRFAEVPAQQVTEDTVSAAADFSAVQERLAEDGFAEYERQYILRENGELNVNLALAADESIRFCYYTWRLNEEQGTWEFVEQGDGYYQVSVEQDDFTWLNGLVTEAKVQTRTESAFALTTQGKTFLEMLCRTLRDFDSQTEKDETFWRDFLFYAYTGVPENAKTEQIYRKDMGYNETVVKVSRQEAETYTKLVFGIDLPDIKLSFKDMEEGQTACYYQDGYYYIGVSDFPDYRYTFAGYEESDGLITVKYTVDFEDQSNVGTVSFTVVPQRNENGFIVASKTTEFFDSGDTAANL